MQVLTEFQVEINTAQQDGTISGSPSNIIVKIPGGRELISEPDYKWFVALSQYEYTNNIVNISAKKGNNQIQYSKDSGATWLTITFPDGFWDVVQINQYVMNVITTDQNLQNSPITFNYNGATARVQLYITPSSGYQVKFLNNGLPDLLGFNPGTYTGAYSADKMANIYGGVKAFYLLADNIVEPNTCLRNGISTPMIYKIPRQGPPGSELGVDVPKYMWVPVANPPNGIINEIRLEWVDYMGNEIDFNGQPTAVTLVFKRRKFMRSKD